jgi:hypothetical protein
MSVSRRFIKVFLASPGDLTEERYAAKAAVDEYNDTWAEDLGYHVELVGWEDTIPGYGRPQARINQDLERCEYFIGVMWKRWGMPPDVSGKYTSGFEEEYEISVAKHRETGSPAISLFFKEIDPGLQRDPGPDLKNVLDFKERIIAEKEILFQTFNKTDEFQQRIRRCIADYVKKQKLKEISNLAAEGQARSLEGSVAEDVSDTTPASAKLFSPEGATFLRELISEKGLGGERESIASATVARFRLLANIIGDLGNDKQFLGVHDANILFNHRTNLELGIGEKIGLIDSGLANYSSENTPLWYWLANIDAFKKNSLQVYSVFGETNKRVGALSAMRLMSEPLSSRKPLDKNACIESWFSESGPIAVKVAALEYLAACGTTEDLTAITAELDRGNYRTEGAAINAILRINLRESRENAVVALFELEPA